MESQNHGFIGQEIIERSETFPGWRSKKNTKKYDIKEEFDNIEHLPTSIKMISSRSKRAEMSDARRFVLFEEPYRLLSLRWTQMGDYKKIIGIFEYIITIEVYKDLIGNLPYFEVLDFHNKLLGYKKGDHYAARRYAKENNLRIKQKYNTLVNLHPKIDSNTQRRLQLSIPLVYFIEKNVDINNTIYRGYIFNNEFYSPPRKRKKP